MGNKQKANFLYGIAKLLEYGLKNSPAWKPYHVSILNWKFVRIRIRRGSPDEECWVMDLQQAEIPLESRPRAARLARTKELRAIWAANKLKRENAALEKQASERRKELRKEQAAEAKKLRRLRCRL